MFHRGPPVPSRLKLGFLKGTLSAQLSLYLSSLSCYIALILPGVLPAETPQLTSGFLLDQGEFR